MKTLLIATMMVALLATPATAIDTEQGATFYDNGSCIEADGTPGLGNGTGDCITAADYDEMYSYENLSTIPSYLNPDISIADEAGLDPDVLASLRLLGIGLVDEPFTFRELANGLVIL